MNTSRPTVHPSDYEKLMDLATWLDIKDRRARVTDNDEVQNDLRRIARRLLEIDGSKSFTRGRNP